MLIRDGPPLFYSSLANIIKLGEAFGEHTPAASSFLLCQPAQLRSVRRLHRESESQPTTEVKSWSVHNPVGDLDGLISLKLCGLCQGGRGRATSTPPELTLHSDVALVTLTLSRAMASRDQVGDQ